MGSSRGDTRGCTHTGSVTQASGRPQLEDIIKVNIDKEFSDVIPESRSSRVTKNKQ